MPIGNVFEKINSEYYQLTAAEKKVADYAVLHRRRTQYMSISELAEEAGVAEATVSRFCRRLGYKGYNAFKLAVANSTASREVRSPLSGEVLPGDSIGDLCQKLCSASREALQQTLDLIRPEQVRMAADLLARAGKVLCMGQGGSMLLAHEAAHLFSTALPNYYAVGDTHLQAMAICQMAPGDAVLYFSYSGSTRELAENLRLVRQRRGRSVLITRFPKSPGGVYADVVLQCGSTEGPIQGGSVAARVAQLFLLDVLFSEVCRRDLEGCLRRRAEVAEVISNLHL